MRVVVAHEQTGPVEAIRHILLGLGLKCTAGDCVSFTELPVRLSQHPADLVLVRVGEASLPAAQEAMRQASALTASPILAMGPAAEPAQVLQILQGGAREYLDEGDLRQALEASLEKLRVAGAVKQGQGTVIGVLSATPGSGVTTVAANLAFIWAEKHPNQVALVELGRDNPDLALSLDLNPRHTVTDVHQNWQRLDATLLRQSMLSHPGGVQVLAHKPETLDVTPLDPQAVRKAVILMRTIFTASMLDLGHLLYEEHYEALRLCDFVAVVVRLDVPALRQARRFLRLLEDRGVPSDRIRVVANRYGQRGQIAWKQAEEAIGTKFAAYIPEDNGKMNLALNQGQPVVRVTHFSSIARRFYKLANLLNGRPAAR